MFEALNTLFTSTAVVAIAEIGDKTQLLFFALAARYRKATPIIWGILLATLLNHFAAASLGQWLFNIVGQWFSPTQMKYALAISFLIMAAWLLIPDRLDGEEINKRQTNIFLTTFIAFFLAEMGDKTQIATALFAAKTQFTSAVVVGTTLGMMIANVPAVLMGDKLAQRVNSPKLLQWMHRSAATIFVLIATSIAVFG
jgi:Ca2+/H+ antiporter, TMEM165/GDT1 family